MLNISGISAVIMTYPLDVVRARLAFQVSGEHVYSGIMDTLSCIFKTVSMHIQLFYQTYFKSYDSCVKYQMCSTNK